MAKRVLIVDDDADFREAAEVVLGSAGYEVAQAANATEAEAALARQKFDLLLLDVMMDSDTDGFHLAYKIRQDARLKDLPIIMLTSIEKETGEPIDAAKAGDYLPVQAFLRKPLNAGELKAAAAKLLK